MTREAVEHYCRREWAVHLDDVMLRRTEWHYYERDNCLVADQAAAWMQETLGWNDAERQEELRRLREATR